MRRPSFILTNSLAFLASEASLHSETLWPVLSQPAHVPVNFDWSFFSCLGPPPAGLGGTRSDSSLGAVDNVQQAIDTTLGCDDYCNGDLLTLDTFPTKGGVGPIADVEGV